MIPHPFATFAQIVLRPAGGCLAGRTDDAAAFGFVGKVPATEAETVFVNELQPLGSGVKIIATISGSITHTKFTDKYGKSVLYAGF